MCCGDQLNPPPNPHAPYDSFEGLFLALELTARARFGLCYNLRSPKCQNHNQQGRLGRLLLGHADAATHASSTQQDQSQSNRWTHYQ